MSIRDRVQNLIEEFQFQFDVFPPGGNWSYQPLPWIGLHKTVRGQGTQSRFEAIETSLMNYPIASGMDIGSNAGYFCFALAQKGIPMLGVDVTHRNIRIAEYAARKMGISTVAFLRMAVNTETTVLLPNVDLVLLLSVWHHWVRAYGLVAAGQILSGVWAKTNKVLFFETGEAEMPADFGLSAMGESPKEWLTDYLSTICTGSEIVPLGLFKAFAPLGNEHRNVVYRNMFMVVRRNEVFPEGQESLSSALLGHE